MFDDARQYIGSFEIGIDFSSIVNSLKAAYGVELAVFIKEEPLKNFATGIPQDIFSDQNRIGQYLRYYSTNTALIKALVKDRDLNASDGNHYIRETLGVFYGVALMPLRNAQGKALGMVVISKDFSDSRAAQNRSIVWQILMALFAIVFMSGLIMIVIRGAFLRPLQALTQHFSHLADNDPNPDTPMPDKLCKELEELAHQYDRLRKSKVRLQK